jgi:hypothetical protein
MCILSLPLYSVYNILDRTSFILHLFILVLELGRFLIFMLGHDGVKGNERVDMLASGIRVQAGPVMDRSDILYALREIGRCSDSVQYGKSENMDRLHDLHIQRGISKREYHAEVT